MEVNQDLINKFFENACSAEEADAVAKYFSMHKDALDKYLDKSEWDNIPAEENFDSTVAQQTLVELKQQLFKNSPAKVIGFKKSQLLRFAAAAAVVLIVVGAWFYQYQPGNSKSTVKEFSNTELKKIIADSLIHNNWQVKNNNSKKPVRIPLNDGSVITLFKGSVVQYPQPFENGKREIILNGAALFNVAKNKQQPFIVYSGNLSTTALGTSFIVTAYNEGRDSINIKLFTGKVVIKSAKHTAGWKKDIFLSPNEQLTYNTPTEATVVAAISNNTTPIAKTDKVADKNAVGANNELKFSNTSLPEVMKALSVLYNVKISYINSDIAKMNFTGVINRTDDVQAILKIIAQMNGLKVAPLNDGFSISKPE